MMQTCYQYIHIQLKAFNVMHQRLQKQNKELITEGLHGLCGKQHGLTFLSKERKAAYRVLINT